jgi:hypothetical protein
MTYGLRVKIPALVLILSSVLMTGCGASPATQGASRVQAQSNNPIAADSRLGALWSDAQQVIATGPIVLNAALVAEGLEAQNAVNGDPRAVGISSAGVQVLTIPDLTVTVLANETGKPISQLQHQVDPTGIIHCPQNTGGAVYCAGFMQNGQIYVAASMLYNPGATGYEMQNVILEKLGYNISKR